MTQYTATVWHSNEHRRFEPVRSFERCFKSTQSPQLRKLLRNVFKATWISRTR